MYAFWATLSPIQKYLISIERDLCHLIVLFAMPTVVALSQCTVVRGCRRPSRYVPYKGTFVPYDGTFGTPDQGQTLDV